MKHLPTLILAASLALSSAAFAGTGGTSNTSCVVHGQQLNLSHGFSGTPEEPYGHMLPSLSDSTPDANPYQLQLKPLRANDLSNLQFQTRDNRGPGAGYSSPYLWEVGRGPGYQPTQRGYYNGGYAPLPTPRRY